MRWLLRRETFIALRARRQGYQIASELLNPPLDVTTSTKCADADRELEYQRRLSSGRFEPVQDTSPVMKGLALALLGLIFGLMVFCGIVAMYIHFATVGK
jgi:hypothetical protein